MITLRPYQEECIGAVERDAADGLRRIGVSSATGTGKTVIMSHLAHRKVRQGQRVLIMVHREELVRQTVSKLLSVDWSVSIGVVKANENRGGAAIVVASVQTIARPKRLAQLGRFGLVICDEAHRSMSDQWQTPLVALGAHRADGPLFVGFSATWTRADKRELGSFWEKISFELSTEWAIEQGFLVRPIGKYIRTDIKLDKVKKTAGDYNDRDMAGKLSRDSVRDAIIAGYTRFAADRSGVVFAPTVDTAEFFRVGFEAVGIRTEGLYGTTPRDAARDIHKRHESGHTQVLVSCTRLSEGWDAPWCSAAVIARPTTHQGLFVQQVGRVLRPHPGKHDAIILDPTGVLFKHKLAGIIDLSTSELSDEEEEYRERDAMEAGLRSDEEGYRAVVAGFEDVPLFAESTACWLRTAGGTRFIYARGALVFLVPGDRIESTPTSWHVGTCAVGNVGTGRWLLTNATIDQAERIANHWAIDRDPWHCEVGKPWRETRATQRQKMQAVAAGVRARATQGELWDARATSVASETLDPVQSWQ